MTETSEAPYADSNSSPEPYVAVHDWESDEQVTVTVAEALAEYTGVPAYELPPLYDSVDPDALDAVIRTLDPEGAEGRSCVTFSALNSDYLVTVHADGGVEIDEQV